MSKLAMLEAIPYIHPELPPDEKEARKILSFIDELQEVEGQDGDGDA